MVRLPQLYDDKATPSDAAGAELDELARSVPKLIGVLAEASRESSDIRYKAALAVMMSGLASQMDRVRPLAVRLTVSSVDSPDLMMCLTCASAPAAPLSIAAWDPVAHSQRPRVNETSPRSRDYVRELHADHRSRVSDACLLLVVVGIIYIPNELFLTRRNHVASILESLPSPRVTSAEAVQILCHRSASPQVPVTSVHLPPASTFLRGRLRTALIGAISNRYISQCLITEWIERLINSVAMMLRETCRV